MIGVLGMTQAPCAAGARDTFVQQLTGGSSRAWVLQEIIQPATAGDACTAGAVYTFAASHDLQVTRCQGGRLVASHHAWTVSNGTDGAPTLVVTGIGTYEAMFQHTGPGPRRLRLNPRRAIPGWPSGGEELHMNDD